LGDPWMESTAEWNEAQVDGTILLIVVSPTPILKPVSHARTNTKKTILYKSNAATAKMVNDDRETAAHT